MFVIFVRSKYSGEVAKNFAHATVRCVCLRAKTMPSARGSRSRRSSRDQTLPTAGINLPVTSHYLHRVAQLLARPCHDCDAISSAGRLAAPKRCSRVVRTSRERSNRFRLLFTKVSTMGATVRRKNCRKLLQLDTPIARTVEDTSRAERDGGRCSLTKASASAARGNESIENIRSIRRYRQVFIIRPRIFARLRRPLLNKHREVAEGVI